MAKRTADKKTIASSSLAPSYEAPKSEPIVPNWLWDRPGVAESVDAYWRGSPDEVAHRKRLAALVKEHSTYGDSILEVGCGTGLIYEALKQSQGDAVSYTGLDLSRPMLDIASNRYPEAMFRMGNAEGLDYGDNWFDLTCAFEVFGHSPDCSKAIKELIRVARRTAVFTMWLGSGESILQGSDHNEYPVKWVEAAITAATRTMNCRVTHANVGYVEAFVIEKV